MSHKKIRRAAIRYQNSQARRGGYVPSIEEAIREVLKNQNDNQKTTS
jgi:hypothetical protein